MFILLKSYGEMKIVFQFVFSIKINIVVIADFQLGGIIMKQIKEKVFDKNTLLVSVTDKKGIITYINDDFCDISGYSAKELLGRPHNIVRHRDMPRQAFRIIWEEFLLQGKEWSGIVKNSCKDKLFFYVVYAHITPIFEGKTIVGFTSVRRCPTKEEKDMYLEQYRIMKSNKN